MEKATPTIVGCLLVSSGSATMYYIIALPLPTRKQTTMVGMAFSISEIIYSPSQN
jgi:hypothetical protein